MYVKGKYTLVTKLIMANSKLLVKIASMPVLMIQSSLRFFDFFPTNLWKWQMSAEDQRNNSQWKSNDSVFQSVTEDAPVVEQADL